MKAISADPVRRQYEMRREGLATGKVKVGKIVFKDVSRRRRSQTAFALSKQRTKEIERVIVSRHGSTIPDPSDTDDRATCLAYARAIALSLSGQDIVQWARRWMPWATAAELVPFAAEAGKRRQMMSADGAAGLIMLTYAERTKLGINTIGACDMTKAERLEAARETKRVRDRNRQTAERSASGRQDRASYLAQHSTERDEPWKAAGVSRSTWFRRRATGPSRVDIVYITGDTPVSASEGIPPTPTRPDIHGGKNARGKAVRRGLGTESPTGCQGAAPHGTNDTEIEEAA